MEFLNQIELKGLVGNVYTQDVNGNSLITIHVVTEYYVYTSPLGTPTIETMWFPCLVWVSEKHPNENARSIKKGDHVHIIGRLRPHKYMDEGFNGSRFPVTGNQVCVRSVEKIDE